MLNPFPIQFLSLFAHFILRVCVGVVLLRLGVRQLRSSPQAPRNMLMRGLGIIELAAGVMFLVGFYTQIAALTMVFISFFSIIFYKRLADAPRSGRSFYLLLLGTSLSLLITGAGFFAFDLPI